VLTWPVFFSGIAPVVVYLIINGVLVRRALDAGFGYEDLIAGLRQELEDRREERRFEVGREPPLAFKIVRWFAYGAWGVLAAVLLILPMTPVDVPVAALVESYGAHFAWLIIIALAGSAFGMMYPGRRLSDRDWLSSLRWKFWHGRFGRWLVRMSGIGGNARTRATGAHRPTEIAIGLAAQDLYDALPRKMQQDFRDLPRILRRLEDEAQAVRTRVSKLTSTEAGVGPPSEPGAAEHARLIADLRAAKQREQDRLATTVAALEAIRLDLLRLSAGVGDPASLSRAMTAAARLGQQVDASVQSDRPVARTPV
jgi:hypothetical protein